MDLASTAAFVAAYLIGSVDFGVIVPRVLGIDIYQHGSGNPGASNVLRSLGRRVAAVVVAGDLTKGVVAAMLGHVVGGVVVGFACGFAAVAGHCFPIWHSFRGGKGVAAGGGVTLWMEPLVGVVLLGVWLLIASLGKKASLASLIVAAAYLPGLLVAGNRGWAIAWAAAMVVLIVARHHDNIRRLVGGAEHAIEPR